MIESTHPDDIDTKSNGESLRLSILHIRPTGESQDKRTPY